jgi:hypothetical protein
MTDNSKNVFDIVKIQERFDYLKTHKPVFCKVPSLTECIYNFIQTDKGKKVILEYIKENDLYNHDLINEIKNYKIDD